MTESEIRYRETLSGLRPRQLTGFFVGWQDPPSPEVLLRMLSGSRHVWLAQDTATGNVVGLVNAISDGVLSAYIPLLEVLPGYQGRGIGRELTRRMLETCRRYYMCDLICDEPLQEYYESLGMERATGMLVRHYERQSGEHAPPPPPRHE